MQGKRINKTSFGLFKQQKVTTLVLPPPLFKHAVRLIAYGVQIANNLREFPNKLYPLVCDRDTLMKLSDRESQKV